MISAIAAALAFAGSTLAGPGTPQAMADDPGVAIALTSVTPDLTPYAASVTIAGSVNNDTNRVMKGLRVTLWQSTSAIKTLAALNAALASQDITSPTGVLVTDGTQPSQMLFSTAVSTLGPRTTAEFSLTGTLDLPTAGSAYLVGVQVLDANDQVLARARLLLGYPADDQPAVSALVVPLTVSPTLVTPAVSGDTPSQAVFQNENLADDLAGGLGQLLTLALQPGVTPLIDPQLVDELTEMAAGYQVVGDDDQLAAGTGQEAAQAALDSINALIARGGAYRLPYGNPDINALAAAPDAAHLAQFLAPDAADPTASLPLALYIKGQAPSSDASKLITNLVPAMVVSDALDTAATLQTSGDAVRFVAATPVNTLGSLSGPAPYFSGAATMQPLMVRAARFAVTAGQGAPTVVVADDGASAQLATDWMGEGWAPVAITQAIQGLKPVNLAWTSQPAPATLPDDLAAALTRIQGELGVVADVGNDPQTSASEGRRLIPAALSATWQGDWAAASSWLQLASAKLEKQTGTGSVELHSAADWILSATNNRMPISVVNGLGIPVTVQVRFTSESPRLLNVPETDPVVIDPGATATVIAMPQAHGNGTVRVSMQLYTMHGKTVGSLAQVHVVTTAAGRLGWIIIIGSGIAFVVATSLRVRQVRRNGRDTAVVSPAEGPDDNAQ